MSHSVVAANGLRFAYLDWGEGPLVLALHGFPDTPHTWNVIGPAIAAKGFRVVAPFLRGYAPSEASSRDTTTRDLGEDTIALIGALRAQRAHLVGHDWGAEAVYAAVGLAPERVITLTAIGFPTARPSCPRRSWVGRCVTSPRFGCRAPSSVSRAMTSQRWSS